MPKSKISFQDNKKEIGKFIKELNRDVDNLPKELQYIAKIKQKESN